MQMSRKRTAYAVGMTN